MDHLTTNELVQLDGFRLQRLEVLNWGTFNQRVWTMEPNGHTALLTGANGSGKSTLVDALLTLLVPYARRSYNQASGAERRRERDERTYVRGAYSRAKISDDPKGSIQYLRDRSTYSVLLGVFHNARMQQTVSLAQVFWQQEEGLKKFHVVAQQPLTITQDFQLSGGIAELRKRLKNAFYVVDEFSQYSKHFCKLFGLRSDKALDLFSQIVSIKEIGGLNDFVRTHMLEKTDAQTKITELRENYYNLTQAHDAIQKAQQQRDALQPLVAEADQYAQQQNRITEAERLSELVPLYFAQRKLELLDAAIKQTNDDIGLRVAQSTKLEAELEQLRENERQLYAAITNDQAGQRIEALSRELDQLKKQLERKRLTADKYNQLAQRLKLPKVQDLATFSDSRSKAQDGLRSLEHRRQELIALRDQHKQEATRLETVCRLAQDDLDSLRQRKSQIPTEDLRLRAQLVQALGIAEDALPFVGELLKVKTQEQPWEGAIERLLGGYARQLLVPEQYYARLSQYVDQTHLGGRLVYHRVGERRVANVGQLDQQALFFKLEIKPGTAFHDWLKTELIDHYNYVCCGSLDQFRREQRALTINGQIKHGGARHEKNDRYALDDRRRYVLGWDNRDKIAAIAADLAQHQQALAAVKAQIAQVEHEQNSRDQQRRDLTELLAFDDWSLLDWQHDLAQQQQLQAQLKELQASANHLEKLQTQLDETKATIKGHERTQSQYQAALGILRSDLKRYEQQRSDAQQRLEQGTVLADLAERITQDLKGQALSLHTIDELQAQARASYSQSASSLRGRLNQIGQSLISRMTNYKRDYPAETSDIDAQIEALPEFRAILQRIERDDLPVHARRFKELLDEKVIMNITSFQSTLYNEMQDFRASIDNLNTSLRRIDYTPATYIKLSASPTADREVQEFQAILRNVYVNVGQVRTPEMNEESFQRIRKLIERFENEERWTAKVSDVRNWLDFSAEECYKADDSMKNFYSDSSGKSGGQKAKLAYTILASAIAYQYGLDQAEDQVKTFRFVVVDEAFSKSDETNARYAMELFKQLHLQLLVVTPLDKTHIVEPYIAACHFVANTQDENDSRVYNLTLAEYHSHKATLAATATTAAAL